MAKKKEGEFKPNYFHKPTVVQAQQYKNRGDIPKYVRDATEEEYELHFGVCDDFSRVTAGVLIYRDAKERRLTFVLPTSWVVAYANGEVVVKSHVDFLAEFAPL